MEAPSIGLPKGGGAVHGIGEKFTANSVTGTGSMTLPIATSPGRSGFGPQLALSYDSGSGNGVFGFGWSLSLPQVSRKTDKGLPRYDDATESDVFVISGAEDLVPLHNHDGSRSVDTTTSPDHTIYRYVPRIEGSFTRIERWTANEGGDVHWQTISRENVLSVYGKDALSRIADPADGRQIFSWLLCETRDDRGNAIIYDYKLEDGTGIDPTAVHELQRGETGDRRRTTNRYLKHIRYGNQGPLLAAGGQRPRILADNEIRDAGWLFEVVFDYGEHDTETPESGDAGSWTQRADAFSSYRPGFEVRTSRLCRRVLMFHHFSDERTVGRDCLVRSLDFDYTDPTPDPRNPGYAFLRSATQCGYARRAGGYLKRTMPRVEFAYSEPQVSSAVEDVAAEALENLPVGLDGTDYRWIDLHGEGSPGIFTDQAGTWFYKRNLSPAASSVSFASLETVATKPNIDCRPQFVDIAGDGLPDLVEFSGATAGFAAHDQREGWEPFRPFASHPVRDIQAKNVQFVDLDGDGHPDLLIADDNVFAWHKSLAEGGYDGGRRIHTAIDDDDGPRMVFTGDDHALVLADMSGDGLTDLVRITNGEVCYWPNLGYGRFGSKVSMSGSPTFDRPEQFDAARLRVADIDGGGPADIVYLHADGVQLHFNQSGNSWGRPHQLEVRVDDAVAVQVVDLLGNGTACLVWSSALPGDTERRLRFVNLIGAVKPHLLTGCVNNLGAETRIDYAPSTKFYLQDRFLGRPWITKLPFPVHVVERLQTLDAISGNRFVTRYAYHHGYFDGSEREFRGFGRVDQWDTEEFALLTADGSLAPGTNDDATSHIPPVLTKTWFHTGSYIGRVSDYFAGMLDDEDDGEYFREPALSELAAAELLLTATILPAGLSIPEEQEACRALKGAMLRQEIYGLDATARAEVPYTVTEQNFTVATVQPRGTNRHAVFLPHPYESVSYHYERDSGDPRVSHTVTLDVDRFGNVLRSAAVSYGRRVADPSLTSKDRARQQQTLVTLTENTVTNPVEIEPTAHRTPLSCEVRTYELTGMVRPAGQRRFAPEEIRSAADTAIAIDFEIAPSPGTTQKRLIEHVRTLFRRDDLTSALPPRALESMALPYENYRLALTAGLVATVFGGRVSDAMLAAEGGYKHLGDTHWWIPSGRIFYSPSRSDNPADELQHARRHFFQVNRYRDPFDTAAASTESLVRYDAYDLLVSETQDALGNRVTAGQRDSAGSIDLPGNDYRVLAPRMLTDANGNRSATEYDTLGLVVGTAVMGKRPPGAVEGDSLLGFVADLTDAETAADLADPTAAPESLLRLAGSRMVYDLLAYQNTKASARPQPVVIHTITRERHAADPAPAAGVRIRHALTYSDGFGREIQRKVEAEPGPVPVRDGAGRMVIGSDGQPRMTADPVSPRWVATGWTVFNNKGNPVRQFEPFFTDLHRFEADVRVGVSPIVCYDPLARVVATVHPDHTWHKTIFGPWRQEVWDANDTVLIADPAADPNVGSFFQRLPSSHYLPTWADQRAGNLLGTDQAAASAKAAVHAATPMMTHTDSLGRTFLNIATNAVAYTSPPATAPQTILPTRTFSDIAGNPLEVIDAAGRSVMRYTYDLLNQRIRQDGMDAGTRWLLNDVSGAPLYSWDDRQHQFHNVYDVLRRQLRVQSRTGVGAEITMGRIRYGEADPAAEQHNLRGKVVENADQAGVLRTFDFDFKGNPLSVERQLAVDYKSELDWSVGVPMQPVTYPQRTRYDALNRATAVVTPDNTVQRMRYTEAGLLDAVDANLGGAQQNGQQVWTPIVTNVDYDAKGQRTLIEYGNGVRTAYSYDPLTHRIITLATTRSIAAFPDDSAPVPGWPGSQVQNLRYVYDPEGNVTQIRDTAQQTLFFQNKRVEPNAEFTYDALYRLIEATGREHLGLVGAPPTPSSYNDHPRIGATLSSSDGNAVGRYREIYEYDAVGNLLTLIHRGTDPSKPGWTRTFDYAEPGVAGGPGNRLTSTTVGPVTEIYSTGGDGYDAHGNMLRMPQLQALQWDYRDQLRMTRRQAVNASDADGTQRQAERTWYVYDSAGQRVAKVTETAAGVIKDERIYLGGFEMYGRRGVKPVTRTTLHVMDDQQRVALIETRIQGVEPGVPAQLIRYQLSNHLGSASLELDDQARIVSYEEYTPYGSTSYQAVAGQRPKRYRFTGKERDDESGLYYHGARYYAPWIGRWTQCDPAGEGVNGYLYVSARPIVLHDPDGREEKQLWLMNQQQFTIRPVARAAERGITPLQNQALRGLDYAFGPGQGGLHWLHPDDQPFVTQPAGTRVPLTPGAGRPNMLKANEAGEVRSLAVQQGKFTRVYLDGRTRDLTVAPGTKFSAPPPGGFEADLAAFAKQFETRIEATPAADGLKLTAAPPVPPGAPVAALAEQLALPFTEPTAAVAVKPKLSPAKPPAAASQAVPAATAAGAPAAGRTATKVAVAGAEKLLFVVTVGSEGEDHESTAIAVLTTVLAGKVVQALPVQVKAAVAGTLAVAAWGYLRYKIDTLTDQNLNAGVSAIDPRLDVKGTPYSPPKTQTLGDWFGF